MKKKLIAAFITIILISISIFSVFGEVHARVDTNVLILNTSTLGKETLGNASRAAVLSTYMDPGNQRESGPLVYFPFSLSGHPDIVIALIANGPNITLMNATLSAEHYFVPFSIAMLGSPNSSEGSIGIHINSVKIHGNQYYNGKIISSKNIETNPEVKYSAFFLGKWNYGTAYYEPALLTYEWGGYPQSLIPGKYTLIVDISVYEMHFLSKTLIGNMTLTMPWAIAQVNYSGPSYACETML